LEEEKALAVLDQTEIVFKPFCHVFNCLASFFPGGRETNLLGATRVHWNV